MKLIRNPNENCWFRGTFFNPDEIDQEYFRNPNENCWFRGTSKYFKNPNEIWLVDFRFFTLSSGGLCQIDHPERFPGAGGWPNNLKV